MLGVRPLFVLVAAATTVAGELRVVMEQGVAIDESTSLSGWMLGDHASAHEEINLIFMLRHDETTLHAFEQTLWAVSTPGDPRYGKYLSREEVAAQLPAVPGATDGVFAWLEDHKVVQACATATGDMIEVNMTVATAEKMFDTQLHHFKHRSLGLDVIRATRPYSVVDSLRDKLYLVGNLAQLPALRFAEHVELPEDVHAGSGWPKDCGISCHSSVTPEVLKQAYGLGDAPDAINTTMAVAEFQGVSWDQGDLDHFKKQCSLKTDMKIDGRVGTNIPFLCKIPLFGGELCAEALLDIEYIKSVGGDIPLTSVSDLRFSLLNWAKQLDNLKDLPPVHSVSYGNDEVQQTSARFMDACNAQFMKLGARGVSILFASGDQGVYGRTGPGSDGRFHPDFPASSPYITAVGGTDFVQRSVIGPEKAWSASGGGFSDHFSVPPYQQEAVAEYKKVAAGAGVLPSQAHWNQMGRGYPDVAALGGQQNPYCVSVSLFIKSSMMGVAGTSASCPVVAGMVARLNALRAQKGLPNMGFLNPFIYQHAEAFNDVKEGKNQAMGPEGFEALAGWDPTTGMGTPNFPKLAAAALAAASAGRAPATSTLVV